MSDFLDDWRRFHPDSLPVSHGLKHSEADRWLRFHSLPESRRYAETEADTAIILDRQNTLAREILGEGAACWIISHLAVSKDADVQDLWSDRARAVITARSMPPVARFDDPADPDIAWDIFASPVAWHQGTFDDLLRITANDETRFMWMSRQTGAIFAPYDGGVDLILPDDVDIAWLALAHSDWLSSSRDGY